MNRVLPNRRYVGSYHWNDYWGHWDKVLGVNEKEWVVAECDLEGVVIKRPRRHSTPLNPGHFALKPFDVRTLKGEAA